MWDKIKKMFSKKVAVDEHSKKQSILRHEQRIERLKLRIDKFAKDKITGPEVDSLKYELASRQIRLNNLRK